MGGLPPLPGEEAGYGPPTEPGYPSQQPSWAPTPITPMQHAAYQPVSYQELTKESTNKELEIISAKLDSIRANLDAINQRLANLERVAYGEKEKYERIRW